MILKQCLFVKNDCYKKGVKMNNGKPTGIVVHSTGANNKTLKRYVNPVSSQSNYNTILQDIGKNIYDNDWNRSGVNACVHAFIGVNASGMIETYQTLPWDMCCWGCASGSKGSYNRNPNARIQFEICEDSLTDVKYFNEAMKEAQELCAYLCKKFGFGVNKICSHYESYYAGYGSNHGDPDHWLRKFNKNMNWFRSEVQKIINETSMQSKMITCRRGDKNDYVKIMQQKLISFGYSCGSYGADSSFGPATLEAVKSFQKDHRLDVDGICGPLTWAELNR